MQLISSHNHLLAELNPFTGIQSSEQNKQAKEHEQNTGSTYIIRDSGYKGNA